MSKGKHKCSAKVWLELNGKRIVGPGVAKILQAISEEQSISKAATKLGMSYGFTWGQIREIQKTMGAPVITTFKGGKVGGGGATLTELGQELLSEYRRLETYIRQVIQDTECWETVGLKISARNQLQGRIVSVEKDGITGKVKIELEAPTVITAVITKEAVEDLDLKVGDKVQAIVKSTEVMVAK